MAGPISILAAKLNDLATQRDMLRAHLGAVLDLLEQRREYISLKPNEWRLIQLAERSLQETDNGWTRETKEAVQRTRTSGTSEGETT